MWPQEPGLPKIQLDLLTLEERRQPPEADAFACPGTFGAQTLACNNENYTDSRESMRLIAMFCDDDFGPDVGAPACVVESWT